MNLVTFHHKNIEQRAELVSQKGIYLASRQDAFYSYHLFYVQQLFVEVTQKIPGNDLILIRGFINVFSLSAYLDLIDISALDRDGNGLF
ncbi:hypothetical protein HUW51_00295 (plasmid) [Adhaeribacter swui]|uniref:Uncharacterized protein n=1 Tax=Adhaeribacter swui TaxID=2086471 RepID=A0A7G7G247_9BACT|nr:hypothetical protein [Adhaeribacter swui]QNF31231.1 hypothetical protein HUW51_00295 [Adhaeribacter swui]